MPRVRDVIAYVVPLLQTVYLVTIYHLLPARIASHFDAAGVPHSFAPRAFLWIFVFISAADVALLRFVRSRPQYFNLPAPRNSPERAAQEAAAENALAWISLEVALMFSFVLWAIVQQGLHPGTSLKFPYLPIGVACIMVLGFIHVRGVLKASNT